MWPLSQEWYGNRVDPNYRPATIDHLQHLLTDVGLTSGFWQLR